MSAAIVETGSMATTPLLRRPSPWVFVFSTQAQQSIVVDPKDPGSINWRQLDNSFAAKVESRGARAFWPAPWAAWLPSHSQATREASCDPRQHRVILDDDKLEHQLAERMAA
jgi:hypothetical protein